MATETRPATTCEGCGVDLPEGAVECPACGHARLSQSVAPLGSAGYDLEEAPPGPYEVELGSSETLSWTFRMWADSLPRLAALAFAPYLFLVPVAAVATAVMAVALRHPGMVVHASSTWAGPVSLVLVLLWFVTSLASAAAVVRVVDEKVRGLEVTAWEAFVSVLPRVGSVFLASVLTGLLAVVAAAGPLLPLYASVAARAPSLALLAIPGLATTAAAVILASRLLPTLPAIVVEEKPFCAAVARAWQLTRGHTTTLVGATLLFALAWMGISMTSAMIGVVPVLGAFAQVAVHALIAPLAYVFPFAVYAGAVREEQRAAQAFR